MKTLLLLVGVGCITIAAIFAGRYAQNKQLGAFPPGDNNASIRTGEKLGPANLASTAPNGSGAAQNAAGGTMPQVGMEFPSGNQVVLEGCLMKQSGSLLVQRQNQHAYRIEGDIPDLQANLGRWVQVAGYEKGATPQSESAGSGNQQTVFVVQQLEQTGPGCKPQLPITIAVSGEAGGMGYEAPATTTQSLRQATSGSITETGEQQAPGTHIGPSEQKTLPVQQQPSTLQGAPPNGGRAGNTPFNAEQASRAVNTAKSAAKAASGGNANTRSPASQGENQEQNSSHQDGSGNPRQR